MKKNIDLFIVLQALDGEGNFPAAAIRLAALPIVHRVYLLSTQTDSSAVAEDEKIQRIALDSLTSMKSLRALIKRTAARYTAFWLKPVSFTPGYRCLERLIDSMEDTDAAMTYADRYLAAADSIAPHRCIDYQMGSLRDDFDFGALTIWRTAFLHDFIASTDAAPRYRFAAFYAMRLYVSRRGTLFHLPELLYTEGQNDLRRSGEKQFDYVNPAAREAQVEYERACTHHLKQLGAWLAPDEYDQLPSAAPAVVEASVIIPVRNRVRTIADAVGSALTQQTDFQFNVIVVDNYSTDGTLPLLRKLQQEDSRLIVIDAPGEGLGIGGCWDVAIRHEQCGAYAVQLDSDDLYSSPHTLQRIVDTFRREPVAMVIGAYRMVDFALQTLPPGLIDHKEWTDTNGRNNALRINGLGAPRAFRTDLLRRIGFPNTSYGEDYALGLAFSRRYKIGRIYDELYLCRRWDGNSDAALSPERVNANNYYKDSLRSIELKARRDMIARWNHPATAAEVDAFIKHQLLLWPVARERCAALTKQVRTRELAAEDFSLTLQYNPGRIISTAAKVDADTLRRRPCFLCETHRPGQQIALAVEGDYEILINPFPILPRHLTIPTRRHRPQTLECLLPAVGRLAWALTDNVVFYNGPRCGASAPDHAHLQAGARGVVPLERDWKFFENRLEKIYPLQPADIALVEENGYTSPAAGIYRLHGYACGAFVILGGRPDTDGYLLRRLMEGLGDGAAPHPQPDINLLSWRQQGPLPADDGLVVVVFPRRKHRPDAYYATDDKQILVSPGALDMAGLIITPRETDFNRLTAADACRLLQEVGYTAEQMRRAARAIGHTHSGDNHQQSAGVAREALRNHGMVATQSLRPESLLASVPEVSVGILRTETAKFYLNGNFTAKGNVVSGPQQVSAVDGALLWEGNIYSELTFHPADTAATFTLEGVTIGVDFHWQQQQQQTFSGRLRLIVDEGRVVVINILPVEDYLSSVIRSEMSGASSPELLKAHAVISRSWVMSQMLHKGNTADSFSFVRHGNELIKWYDHDDHQLFDVCADDHCQRYQGLQGDDESCAALQAVRDTHGLVLSDANGAICDARFSKCCGGITERYSTCWDDADVSYLTPVADAPESATVASSLPHLDDEEAVRRWILSPQDDDASFCHTTDEGLLRQVLKDYDRTSTPDFYRWTVRYTQEELSNIIRSRREEDFGDIVALEPVERGNSGRLKRLRIVGTKRTLVIGKELEIRRSLSPNHLLSSAFVVDYVYDNGTLPTAFILHGAGWGHGVGLCQIGAAVMSAEGYSYEDILHHYYRGAEIKKLYE